MLAAPHRQQQPLACTQQSNSAPFSLDSPHRLRAITPHNNHSDSYYLWRAGVASLQQLRRYFLSKSRSGMSIRTRKTARTCFGVFFFGGRGGFKHSLKCGRICGLLWDTRLVVRIYICIHRSMSPRYLSTHPPTYLCAVDLGHRVARLGVRVRQRVVHRLYIHTHVGVVL